MIDLGMARRYRHPITLEHHPCREFRSLVGTVRYTSLNSHMDLDLSRRDDLETLGYVFIYFLRSSLPWMGIKAETKK